jgi:hypothetical protein
MPRSRIPRRHLGAQPDPMKGKTVYFGPPGDVRRQGGKGVSGTILDEVWVPDVEATTDGTWGRYCFFAQLIRWESGKDSIRLGYFRRRAGENHWEFGSQTTINSNPHTIRELLKQTLAKDEWFKSEQTALS